jgi:hypothetical protein
LLVVRVVEGRRGEEGRGEGRARRTAEEEK